MHNVEILSMKSAAVVFLLKQQQQEQQTKQQTKPPVDPFSCHILILHTYIYLSYTPIRTDL